MCSVEGCGCSVCDWVDVVRGCWWCVIVLVIWLYCCCGRFLCVCR